MKERVQKIIAERGVCSRRAAEKLIADGKVKVNGHPCSLGDLASLSDIITISGKRIPAKRQTAVYYLMNKPRGYITSAHDEKGRKTVLDLLTDVSERVYPVGRLDMGSEGLLLLTNDGELADFLMHPSSNISKEYHVTVIGDVEEAIPKISEGMVLDDGFKTSPAEVRIIRSYDGKTMLSITIKEGHNREVRRMCEGCGLQVRRLVRFSIGDLTLKGIKVGEYRELSQSEINYINSLLNRDKI